MHRDPSTRRGFLRGLTTLPLIGGGVTLIGNPTKAAEPVTPHLLNCYDTWLLYERRFLRFERFERFGAAAAARAGMSGSPSSTPRPGGPSTPSLWLTRAGNITATLHALDPCRRRREHGWLRLERGRADLTSAESAL